MLNYEVLRGLVALRIPVNFALDTSVLYCPQLKYLGINRTDLRNK